MQELKIVLPFQQGRKICFKYTVKYCEWNLNIILIKVLQHDGGQGLTAKINIKHRASYCISQSAGGGGIDSLAQTMNAASQSL